MPAPQGACITVCPWGILCWTKSARPARGMYYGVPLGYTNFNKLYYDKERTYYMKPIKEGKVREIYDNGDSLIMVATDRIS